MKTSPYAGLERGVATLAIRPHQKLSKTAKRKLLFHHEKIESILSYRQQKYLEMLRGELSLEGGEAIVRQRLERLTMQGGDIGPDGGAVNIDVQHVTRLLLETKASGAMRRKGLTPAAVQDGRAFLSLAEQQFGTARPTVSV